MRQLIIARKDLNMSAGKLAAQVSHASMAFLTAPLRNAKGDKKMKNALLTLTSEYGIIYNKEKLFKIYNTTIK